MIYRATVTILLSCCTLLLTEGCKGRDHINPLDPMNPSTGGTPDNLNALAGDEEVRLAWNDLDLHDLVGYDLLRLEGDSPETTTLNQSRIPPEDTTWTDADVLNSHTYTYILRFLAPHSERYYSASDVATPGPTTAWTVDLDSPALWRITPDARDRLTRVTGLSGPMDVEISPDGQSIWVADYFGRRVIKYGIDGDFLLEHSNSGAGRGLPVTLGVRASDHTLWIGYRSPGGVSQVDDSGNELAFFPYISDPIDIDIDQGDGTVWVASRGEGTVYRKGPGEEDFTAIGGFSNPVSLSADPVYGRCWIADDNGVTILSKDGGTLFALGDIQPPPVKVAVNTGDGSCWIAHYAETWTITRVGPSFTTDLDVPGFEFISDLAVDPVEGSCWLAAATSMEGRVIKVSKDGDILGSVGGFVYPSAISVLP